MNDLNQMTTPVLQDWWERYVCPTCMSKRRESPGVCTNDWHAVPAVTFECEGSAFSPLSIPVAELSRGESRGPREVAKYGHIWVMSALPPRRRRMPAFV